MARLVPGGPSSGCGYKGKDGVPAAAEEEDVGGGCGSSAGRTSGGEMAAMDRQLRENEEAEGLEIDIAKAMAGKQESKKELPIRNSKPIPQQTLGSCKLCGYMSSQDICQACMLLEGLNKNRAQIQI